MTISRITAKTRPPPPHKLYANGTAAVLVWRSSSRNFHHSRTLHYYFSKSIGLLILSPIGKDWALVVVVVWLDENVFHPLPQGEVWSRLTEIQVGSMFLSSRSLNQIVHYGIPVHQSILNRSLYATTYAQGAIVLSVHVTYLLAGISLSSHTTNFHVCMFVSSASAATRTYLI